GQTGGTGQMVSTKGGAQKTLGSFKRFMNQNTADWKAIPHTFGDGNDIGLDAMVLERKEFSTSPITRLYHVRYKDYAVLLAFFGDELVELGGGFVKTAHALDRFQDHRAISFR